MNISAINGFQAKLPKINKSQKSVSNTSLNHVTNFKQTGFNGISKHPNYNAGYYTNSNPISFGAKMNVYHNLSSEPTSFLDTLDSYHGDERQFVADGLSEEVYYYEEQKNNEDGVCYQKTILYGPKIGTELLHGNIDTFLEFMDKMTNPIAKYQLLTAKFPIRKEIRTLMPNKNNTKEYCVKTQITNSSFAEEIVKILLEKEGAKTSSKLEDMIIALCEEEGDEDDYLSNSQGAELLKTYKEYCPIENQGIIEEQIKYFEENP